MKLQLFAYQIMSSIMKLKNVNVLKMYHSMMDHNALFVIYLNFGTIIPKHVNLVHKINFMTSID